MARVGRAIDLLGAGMHAAVVADSARRAGYTDIRVWYERRPDESRFPRGTTFGAFEDLPAETPIMLAFGDIANRRQRRATFTTYAPSLVDPSAVVGHGVSIGSGVVVLPGVIVNTNARVGPDAILNLGCIVGHDCHVGRNTHVSVGVMLLGAVSVGDDVIIGGGAVILPGVSVGHGAIVGAGAVVTGPVRANETVVGVPARPMARR